MIATRRSYGSRSSSSCQPSVSPLLLLFCLYFDLLAVVCCLDTVLLPFCFRFAAFLARIRRLLHSALAPLAVLPLSSVSCLSFLDVSFDCFSQQIHTSFFVASFLSTPTKFLPLCHIRFIRTYVLPRPLSHPSPAHNTLPFSLSNHFCPHLRSSSFCVTSLISTPTRFLSLRHITIICTCLLPRSLSHHFNPYLHFASLSVTHSSPHLSTFSHFLTSLLSRTMLFLVLCPITYVKICIYNHLLACALIFLCITCVLGHIRTLSLTVSSSPPQPLPPEQHTK